MKIADSIRLAISDMERNEVEAAMLHACNAIDGTAAKIFNNLGSNARFTKLLRENYDVFGPMAAPGINLADTRFPISLPYAKASGGNPDIADIIYGVHRCAQGHGEELPVEYYLMPDFYGKTSITQIEVAKNKVHLSDRTIWGLVAVAVLIPNNKDLAVPSLDGYYITVGNSPKLFINEWWGRKTDFLEIVQSMSLPNITLDFSNMMKDLS